MKKRELMLVGALLYMSAIALLFVSLNYKHTLIANSIIMFTIVLNSNTAYRMYRMYKSK